MRNQLSTDIAASKKADLSKLSMQVKEANNSVHEKQAIVTALSLKASQFNIFLTEADADKAKALANLGMAQDVAASVASLASSSKEADHQTTKALSKSQDTSKQIAAMVPKLVFSVEIIDKLSNLLNRQKASNPLIPDLLMSYLAKANTDANNAVAATLTALQSCYAAEATLQEAANITTLENQQVATLKQQIEQSSQPAQGSAQEPAQALLGILPLLKNAYDTALKNYQSALDDNNSVTKQLAHAQTDLAAATTQLSSLQAGLAAATAAAYAA